MASGSETDAELAYLSGPELVALLRATYRRADYEAVARVLSARDRRVAEAEAALEAALADVDALQEKYDALLRWPLGDAEETAYMVGIAAPALAPSPSPAHWDEPRVEEAEEGEVKVVEIVDLCSDDGEGEGAEEPRGDASGVPCKKKRRRKTGWRAPAAYADAHAIKDEEDEDTETLCQRWKRLRQGEPGAAESGKGDGQGQSNSVGSLGNDPQKSLSSRAEGPESRTGQMEGTLEDSKVAAFMQGKGVVKPEKGDGGMPRTILLSTGLLVRSALQKGSSKSVHVGVEIGEKEGSSAGPGDAISSQARSTSLTVKKCGESVKTNDEMHEACTGSPPVGVGSMVVRAIREQEGGNGGVHKAKLLPESSGISEKEGNLNSLETGKVGGSNQRDTDMQKKSVNPNSNNLLKSSLRRDKKDARMAEKGGFSIQSYVLATSKVDSVSPKVTKNLAKGNSEMCSAPDGSSGAGARNGVPARRVSQPQKENSQLKKTSMVESSSKCGNKKVEADMQKCSPLLRQTVEGKIARERVPFESMRTAEFPPLGIRNLSGPDLRGYFFESGGTPQASFVDTKTQKLRGLPKGVDCLSKKLVSEEFPKHGEKINDARSKKSSSSSRLGEGAKIIVEGASNEQPRVAALLPLITSSSLPSTTTRHWESDGHMITSFIENMELSMQALCALYRQRKIMIELTEGRQTGNTGLSKSDVCRATKLAEFLLDGDVQGPLKRSAEELVSHDATGPILLQQVALNCSKQLFDIYRNKEDPYFC